MILELFLIVDKFLYPSVFSHSVYIGVMCIPMWLLCGVH